MEEILALKQYLKEGKYSEAMLLLDELEEMSLDDKLNKISSYSIILLLHLIKQEAEQRTTRSWDLSIAESLFQIKKANQQRKSKGFYASDETLLELLHEAYPLALNRASLEALEGLLNSEELEEKVDRQKIIQKALDIIKSDSVQNL